MGKQTGQFITPINVSLQYTQ